MGWFNHFHKKSAEAQYKLGYQLITGEGRPKDADEGVKWIQRAAEQNFAEAQFHMGTIYHQGPGLPQNYEKAAQFYLGAAKQGHPSAQNNLGFLYEKGLGVTANLTLAINWYQRAAANGHTGASQNAFMAKRKLELEIENRQISDTLSRAGEAFRDSLDKMLSHYASESEEDEIEDWEEDDLPTINPTDGVQTGHTSISGIDFEVHHDPSETFAELMPLLLRKLVEIQHQDLYLYRYIVEEADRLASGGPQQNYVLSLCGIMPLEYSGELNKVAEFAQSRPGVEFIKDFCEQLSSITNSGFAQHVRDQTYLFFNDQYHSIIAQTRKKWAGHYFNNCFEKGHWYYAEKWKAVLAAIEASEPALSGQV